ncbi:hypothetical protein T11_12589 [Trichinella zimbabwensis]|uniref:Uncharacterized protein n=1 Tax=Trichinella zimbabwensis TaxID=268475 RepID=A0A0V1HXZ6_9BILA|nr:hypothetical protein T11_12589 [Trichinella zimbabwensis]
MKLTLTENAWKRGLNKISDVSPNVSSTFGREENKMLSIIQQLHVNRSKLANQESIHKSTVHFWTLLSSSFSLK